ncbi:unnamed protein product [Ranitomeya imitator]|uniref:Helix-turn-helix domain-containing protein n=1 Tax=Ranitomeya imitator TaxID=111125 RepID=A0ABN9L090_9NEOB|nr:unnamed protein product [Ranitomeya imitator]
MGFAVRYGAPHLLTMTSSSCLYAAAPAQAYFVCPVEGRAKYCSVQASGLSDLSRHLRTAVLCSALNSADKVRLFRSCSVKTRRGHHHKKMGCPGPRRPSDRTAEGTPQGEYNLTSFSHLSGYIGGLSTALQNAVDKPLMPAEVEDVEACYQKTSELVSSSTTLQVINLSDHVLTPMEFSVLQKGLSFVPTHIADKFTLVKDLYLFCRKLTFQVMYRRPDILQTIPTDERQTFQDLLELLEENEVEPNRRKFPYRNKSLKTPSFSLVPAIKIFFEMVKQDIMAMPIRVSGPSNLSIEEKRALTALQNNRDFTIKEADKGGNVVLWSTQLYEAEAKRQLNNAQYYQNLPSDPTSIFLSKYEQLLYRALQLAIISPQEKQYLWVANPVTATFYMLPKIHKDSLKPPGRPIVSRVGSMCERAGEYLDFFLQPIASSLPSFVRDSSHFIDICSQIILPTDFLLVNCDVESLYSNIDHKDGIEVIAYFLDKKTSMDRGHDSFLLDLMSFVLHHNFFLFDRVHYLQRSGVAMGAKCAPGYANIFLGWWEDKFVYSSPLFAAHVHVWYHFIDDVFIIWKGTEEECVAFFDNLNSNPHNIFLTYSCSARDVTFLDLRVFPHEQHLATNLFRKPTATNALLEFSSFHRWHTKVGVPTGQFLRVRRNCTRDCDFSIQARELSERFRYRGYPKRVISTAYQRAKGQDQKSLLSSKRQGQEMQTRFITDFNNNWRPVSDILSKHWQILRLDAQTSEVTSNRPLLTARRAPNLRDLLTRSHFKRPTVKLNRGITLRGSFPCGDCNICPHMTPTCDFFVHPTLLSRHPLRAYINCRSRDVIYALICPCRMVYVGQTTQELRKRAQKHLSTVHLAASDLRKDRVLTPVAEHFLAKHGGSSANLQVVGLQKLTPNERGGDKRKLLLQIESRWIFKLQTVAPSGLNEELLFTGFLGGRFGLDLPSLVSQDLVVRGVYVHSALLCIMPTDLWDLHSSCVEDGFHIGFFYGK